MYDVSNATYRDAGCPSQCSAMYEYSTVAEMNGVNGALPIPPTSQLRLYQTPSVVNAQNQVVNIVLFGKEASGRFGDFALVQTESN